MNRNIYISLNTYYPMVFKKGQIGWNKGTAKKFKCIICEKEFDYKTTRGTLVCSKECYIKHMHNIRMGELNPRFNNGWRQYHRIMKDIKTCKNCGRKYNLETHHLDGNNHNQDPNNLIKVCRRCHMLLDGRFANLNYHNSGTGLCAKRR